jgi:hypothetical protein
VLDPDIDVRILLGLEDDVPVPVRFRSDVWDLSGHPAWRNKAGGQTKVDFTAVPRHWRALVKEWAVASLDPALVLPALGVDFDQMPADAYFAEPARPVTVQGNVKQASLALRRMEAAGLLSVDLDGWDRVTAALRTPLDRAGAKEAKTVATRTCVQQANQLVALHRFGDVVGWTNPFGSQPWDGQPPVQVFRTPGSERALNSIRPHEAVGHLLGLCAFTFDKLAAECSRTSSGGVPPVTTPSRP